MENKIDIFENENYKFISDFVETKIPILRENAKFENDYMKLSETMESLETELLDIQKEKFNEIIKLMYKNEEYYFALAYSLGVKYGADLRKL